MKEDRTGGYFRDGHDRLRRHMKKRRAVLLLLAAVFLLLTFSGCTEQVPELNTTNLFILNDDGSITQKLVDALPEGESEESMKAYVDAALSHYRVTTGRDGITLDECTVTGKMITITLTYAAAGDYEAYNGVLCFTGTVKEAYEEGYSFQKIFLDSAGNSLTGSDVSSAYWLDRILIINQPMDIQVPGRIYAASDLAQITGEMTVKVTNEEKETVPEEFRVVNDSAAIIIYQ